VRLAPVWVQAWDGMPQAARTRKHTQGGVHARMAWKGESSQMGHWTVQKLVSGVQVNFIQLLRNSVWCDLSQCLHYKNI
jgi:hypothetical protein